MKESRSRSIAKTLSWRVIASVTTGLLVWLFFRDIATSAALAGIDFFAKMGLYYLHERGWAGIAWGHRP